jgi:hypothetical protein
MKKRKPSRDSNRGPLPVDDRNSELQTFSLAAIQRALSPEHFIVRQEQQPDRGVDITIELKERADAQGLATGERANAQV